MRPRRVLLALAAGAFIGIAVFGIMVSRAVDVEQAPAPEALRRFEQVRASLGGRPPLLMLDANGEVVRRAAPPATAPGAVKRLGVLAYQAAAERLTSADVPMWFFKLKGPAAQFAVRGTGLDLERLQITASYLERHDASVVIDHVRPNGDRLLVWTE